MATATKAKAPRATTRAPRAKAKSGTGGIAWARDLARIWAGLGGDPYSVVALHRLQAGGCTAAEISEGSSLKTEAVKRSFGLLSRYKLARASGMGMNPTYELTEKGHTYADFVASQRGTV